MLDTEPEAQVMRRHLGTAPGTTLLMGSDALDGIAGVAQWVRITGMDPARVVSGTLCSSPLPLYVQDPEGPHQFSEVNPATLWHPLFWLPDRLSGPYTIEHPEGGQPIEEPFEAWSIRVALEMTASGLYSPDEGWADVLQMAGIDISTQEGVGRVAAWQSGVEDPALDNIDLEAVLNNPGDPEWADVLSVELLPLLASAQWALMSQSVLDIVVEAQASTDFQKFREGVALAANTASAVLHGAPAPDGAPDMGELFDNVREAALNWNRDRASFESGPMKAAADWLTLLRDEHWPSVEAFDELEAQEG